MTTHLERFHPQDHLHHLRKIPAMSSLSSQPRRTFLKTGSLLTAATVMPASLRAQNKADEIRVAVIGCGGRGTGAAAQSLNVPGTRLVAMADAFPDNMDRAHEHLAKMHGDRVDVPKERRFSGFDAYKGAIDAADVVILTTPPGFRPMHFEYAVGQGKHVFMEKPVAVDGPGIRKVIEAAKIADAKNLADARKAYDSLKAKIKAGKPMPASASP